MKKILSLLLLAAFCLTLCSCHGAKEKKVFELPSEFDTAREYEISFWAKNDTNLTQVGIYKQAIADFQEIYPNIKVNLKLYTDYGRIYNDVITNRKKAIYSIGNMTLLTANLNSKLGNASFGEKIKGNTNYSGYEKYAGNLTIAKEIIDIHAQQKCWDERNIHKRSLNIFNELNAYYKFIS